MAGIASYNGLEMETRALYQRMEGFLELERLGAGGWEELYLAQREGEEGRLLDRVRHEQEDRSRVRQRRANNSQLVSPFFTLMTDPPGAGEEAEGGKPGREAGGDVCVPGRRRWASWGREMNTVTVTVTAS